MTRTHRLTSLALAATLLGTALVAAVAAPAAAHTPSASATCSTLSVSLQYYASTNENPKPNTVSVSIDRGSATSQAFGSSFVRDFSLGDSTKAHSWRVVIDAVDNGYDRTIEGTSTPCPAPLPRDAVASVQITPPTCTAGGTLVLDRAANATWGTPTATAGPAAYSVTATAASGHLFDDGTAKRVFTGSLAGPLDAASATCAPTPPVVTRPVVTKPTAPTRPPVVTPTVPAKPAPLATSERTVTIDCDARMVSTTTKTTTTDWVLDSTGYAWVQAPPVVTEVETTNPASALSCPAVGSGSGSGAGNGSVGGAVGGGAGGGTSAAVGQAAALGSLAHAGTDSLAAIALGIALLLAGVLVAHVRRREGASNPT
jgi:hypothetical protein